MCVDFAVVLVRRVHRDDWHLGIVVVVAVDGVPVLMMLVGMGVRRFVALVVVHGRGVFFGAVVVRDVLEQKPLRAQSDVPQDNRVRRNQ